jgi:hypothetical protein
VVERNDTTGKRSTPSFEKTSSLCQGDLPQVQIVDSSSRKAVNFSSACTMKRFPSLQSPCLTALWLTQPDKLQSLLDERSLNEGGLIPRILTCHTNCEPREIGKNPPSFQSA